MAIARAQVLHRARTIWPEGRVPYSMSIIHQPDGYRQDCSGYVSLCWAIPPSENGGWGGQSTVTLVTRGYMREIPIDDLKPGDAVGLCGPGTAGAAGHIQLFVGWLNNDPNDSRHYVLEQAGGVSGPRKRLVDWHAGYKAYRFRDIAEDGEDDDMTPADLLDTTVMNRHTGKPIKIRTLLEYLDVVEVGTRNEVKKAVVAEAGKVAAKVDALTAAFTALAKSGTSIDTAAVLAEVRKVGDDLGARVAEAEAEVESLRAQLAAAAKAEADALNPAS